jgi:sulfate adenylyltransferase subunit 1 (EFTu-like GTPase family)
LSVDDIEAYLHQHQHQTLLRFITCGSVDDGKSTLIGRLLYESKALFEDQLAAAAPAAVTGHLAATLAWMSERPLQPGQRYLMKLATATVAATVTVLRDQVDVNTLERVPAAVLPLNGIGHVELMLDCPVACDPYRDNRDTGGFILIDRIGNDTVAAGLIESPYL